MHTILVASDLRSFAHIHPRLRDDGYHRVQTMPLDAGSYNLYTEFVHNGEKVLDRRELAVGGPAVGGANLSPDLSPKTVEGTTISLDVPETIRAGEPVHLDFALSEDGKPVTDLSPYLGAAHVAIISEDGSGFAHGHGEARAPGHDAGAGNHEDGGHGVPEAFGPGVRADHTFESPGVYKLWAQFEREGRVLTAPFVVEVGA